MKSPYISALLFGLVPVDLILDLMRLGHPLLGDRVVGSASLILVICAELANVRTLSCVGVSGATT
jgi:hypothetical protein